MSLSGRTSPLVRLSLALRFSPALLLDRQSRPWFWTLQDQVAMYLAPFSRLHTSPPRSLYYLFLSGLTPRVCHYLGPTLAGSFLAFILLATVLCRSFYVFVFATLHCGSCVLPSAPEHSLLGSFLATPRARTLSLSFGMRLPRLFFFARSLHSLTFVRIAFPWIPSLRAHHTTFFSLASLF